MAAKKEVEANPFKRLIDISDLIEFEGEPSAVEKEVQNVMLRHNSELKAWYRLYSRKVEASKSEESFCMTLRQLWRFLRDCQFTNHDATLVTFNRVYNQGLRNHFTLLGTHEVAKFDVMYGLHGDDGSKNVERLLSAARPGQGASSDFEEEPDEVQEEEDFAASLGIEPEDVHGASRIVLQRQFFEAVVRAAYVRYANHLELPTLAEKLDHFIKSKLIPNAGKTKAKTENDEVSLSSTLSGPVPSHLLYRNNSKRLKRFSTSTPHC